jgi:hypothetical protein
VWSLRHYPRFFRYAVLLSSGRLFCVLTRAGCARVLQIWEYFCTVNLSFRTLLLSIRRVIFCLLWTLLQGAHPLKLFLALLHCLPHRLIFSDGSAFVAYLLEPSTLFYFSWDRITRSFSCLPFGRPRVYCILHTLAVFWAGFGCQFRALLYLSQFNPCGEVSTAIALRRRTI